MDLILETPEVIAPVILDLIEEELDDVGGGNFIGFLD